MGLPVPAGCLTTRSHLFLDAPRRRVQAEGSARLLWVPMLDGTERAGLLRIGLDTGVVDDETLRRRLWSLSGLMGHTSKIAYSEHLRRLRGAGRMTPASTLMWQLLPPRTFATGRSW
jgi:hypothetical protein